LPSYARLFFLLFVKLLHKFYKILTIIALGTYEKKSFKWIEKFEVIAFVAALSAIFFPSFAQLQQAKFHSPEEDNNYVNNLHNDHFNDQRFRRQ